MRARSSESAEPRRLGQPPPAVPASGSGEAKSERITPRIVAPIAERLGEGKAVRRRLPGWGRLHVDRQLPFLCVFRRREEDPDSGTEDLLLGEAAYLLASGEGPLHAGLASLVDAAIESQLPSFGSFLVIEIWSSPSGQVRLEEDPEPPKFRIFRTRERAISLTVETLETALGRITIRRKPAVVETVRSAKIAPPGMKPLLRTAGAAKRGVHLLGLEVPEVYRNAETGELLPQVRRILHRGVARALKRTCFEFTRSQPTNWPPHFHALGRRSMVKAVWDVDRRLAEVSTSFDLLLTCTPTNTDAAWSRFRRKRFEVTPEFTYRPLALDPSLIKRALWNIPVERIEDPTLEDLFRRQQIYLDRRLTMLSDRGAANFVAGSLQVFGRVDASLLRLARRVLKRVPPHTRDESKGGTVSAKAFAARAEEEIAEYRKSYPELKSRAEVRDDVSGLLVSRGNLLIGASTRIPRKRVAALINHEVGTHIVTDANGRAQPFRQLYVGLPDYDELQEGLAVLAEYLVGGLSRPRLRLLAARVIAVHRMLDGASFVEVFRELDHDLGFSGRTAFVVTMRVFRGGGLTKDMVYLRGLHRLLDYLSKGGEVDPLLVGKLGVDHIGMVKELQWRKVLKPAPLRPRYLSDSKAQDRLARVQEGISVLDLIKGGER